MREPLVARLGGLETSIDEIFSRSGKGELSAANYENLYRLLCSYRSLSEAAIQFAEDINWARWQEARF